MNEWAKKQAVQTLARLFAPHSLVLSDTHHASHEEQAAGERLAEMLQPGDIILVTIT